MFIEAIDVRFLENVTVELTYIDGSVIKYDMSKMFDKYPQLKALENRELFESGHLDPGGYGIIWNDELDFDAMSIYEDGEIVGDFETTLTQQLGYKIARAREEAGLTQTELSKLTGIDQGDISKLERGQGNPSFKKVSRILDGLGSVMEINIKEKPNSQTKKAFDEFEEMKTDKIKYKRYNSFEDALGDTEKNK